MSDKPIDPAISYCPSCGKPTPENLDVCRHCRASLRGDNAGKKSSRIFADEGPAAKWGCIGMAALFVMLPIFGLSYCHNQSSERERVAAEEDREKAKQDDARYQQRVKTGEVCSDGPNGAVTAFELNVQRQLKDPDSFEHIGTVITPAKDGYGYDALMRFRSANSFGAKVVGTAVGRLYLSEPNTCEVRSFEVEG